VEDGNLLGKTGTKQGVLLFVERVLVEAAQGIGGDAFGKDVGENANQARQPRPRERLGAREVAAEASTISGISRVGFRYRSSRDLAGSRRSTRKRPTERAEISPPWRIRCREMVRCPSKPA
jgi:hypothetical protein